MPDYVDLSEPGKLKKRSGSDVYMRLSENATLLANYEMKIKIQNEIKDDAQIFIGVLDDYNWINDISYSHDDGKIYNINSGINETTEITTINAKLKKHSIIKVRNAIVPNEREKTIAPEKRFLVGITIDDVKSGMLFYKNVYNNYGKLPFLYFGRDVEVELDVEVVSKIFINFKHCRMIR